MSESCVTLHEAADTGPVLWMEIGGQSNGTGNGIKADLPTAYTSYSAPVMNLQNPQNDVDWAKRTGDVSDFPLYSSDLPWTTLRPASGSNGYSVEQTFMRDLANARLGQNRFAVSKFTWAGAGVGNDWVPTVWDGVYTGTPPYPWAGAADASRAYRALLASMYSKSQIHGGFFWVGCEDDAGSLVLANNYAANMQLLIDGSRYLYSNAELEWIVYKPPVQLDRTFVTTVRDQIDLLVASNVNVASANIDDIATSDPNSWSVGDNVHMNSTALILLGQRGATARLLMGF